MLFEPHCPSEGKRVGERQNLSERLDASAQGFFQQLPLGGNQPMLVGRGLNGRKKDLGVARLGEESKDLSVVDCCNRGIQVGLSGEQEPDRVGRALLDLAQESCAVHLGHAHVRDDHAGRIVSVNDCQSTLATGRGRNPIVPPQIQHQPFQHPGLIVDTQDM